MGRFLANRDGGELDQEGIYQFLDKLFPGEVITGFNVTQQGTPAMGIAVQLGTALIPSGSNYPYVVFMDAAENVTLNTADGSNPRIDLIVAYVDLTVVSSASPNNPNALKLDNVTGTPSGSPAVPNAAAIEAVVGASNPYIILARVAVAAGATTVTNSNITDVRVIAGTSNLSNPYKFSAYRNASVIPAANGVVVFDAESFDDNSDYDTSNGRYTITVPGTYWFNACLTYSINGSGNTAFGHGFKVNGGTVYYGFNQVNMYNSVYGPGASAGKLLRLDVGNYIEVIAITNGATSLTLGPDECFFEGFLVSQG